MTDNVHYELRDLVRFEQNKLTQEEALQMFAHLIRTGMFLDLRPHLLQTAQGLILAEIIDEEGNVSDDAAQRIYEL